MPTFWEDSRYKIQCVAVKKLCMRAIELIEDTGIGSGSEIVPDQLASIDLDGINLLADVILFGVESWIIRKRGDELRIECWVEAFLGLISLLKWWTLFLFIVISLTKCTFSDDIAETFPRSSRRAISTDWTVIKTPNVHEDRINMYSVPLYTQEEDKIREEPEKGRERDVDRGGGDDGSDLLSNFGDALGDFASEISLADSPSNWLGASLNHIRKTAQKLPELLNDLDVIDLRNITLTYPVGPSHTVIAIG